MQTREALTSALWPSTIVEEHSLTWNVSALRRALSDEGGSPRYIETVRGHGYRFIAEVTEIPRASARKSEAGSKTGVTRRKPWKPVVAVLAGAVITGVLIWYFAARPGSTETVRTPTQSIAILPFENLSPDHANAYFVRGIHDLILTKLAGIGTLKVIARTSTRDYPSHPRNPGRVAHQLGVSTLLEGSVQQEGRRVLINVQLVDAHNGNHLWAQAYIRKLNNVLDVESDVAEKVATALKLHLLPQESNRLSSIPTQNPKAYDFFLQAEYFAAQTVAGSSKTPYATATHAEKLYQHAITKDPKFALAIARLSILDSYMYWYNIDRTPQRIAEAKKTAKQALNLKPELPESHLAMGYVYYYSGRDYTKALTEFQQVRQTAPNNTEAIGAIAFIQRRQGQWKDALAGLHKAETLDPRNPLWYYELGETLVQLRHYRKALEEFDHALSLSPHSYRVMNYKAVALLLSGKPRQASATLNRIPKSTNPRGSVSAVRFKVAWLLHRPKLALNALASIKTEWLAAPLMPGSVPVSLFRAQALSLAGKQDKAHFEYKKALDLVTTRLQMQADDPNLFNVLALIQVGMGKKAAAARSATRATKLLPISADALYGPSYLTTLAVVHAQSGAAGPAVKLLRRLLNMPPA